MELLSELTEALRATLPATSRTARIVAANSSAYLGTGPMPAPYWLAMRRLQFEWRARLADEGGTTRFLFIEIGERSAREQLESIITLNVQPVPESAAAALSQPAGLPTAVETPHAYSPGAGVLEFRFAPENRMTVRLNDPNVDVHDEDAAQHVEMELLSERADWLRAGKKEPWPLKAFVQFAFAMAAEPVTGGGSVYALRPDISPAKRPQALRARDLVAELVQRLQPVPVVVAMGDAAAPGALPIPLAVRWRFAGGEARLSALVDKEGFLGQPRDEDTFLCPVEIRFVRKDPGWEMALAAGWPDFILRGAVRQAVLDAFTQKTNWKRIANIEPLRGLGCTEDLLQNWLEDERRAVLVRVNREEDDEEVALIMSGEIGGRDIGILLLAEEVSYQVDPKTGNITATFSSSETLQANTLTDATMKWDEGKRQFCDVLHGFLRWDAFVAPLLELP